MTATNFEYLFYFLSRAHLAARLFLFVSSLVTSKPKQAVKNAEIRLPGMVTLRECRVGEVTAVWKIKKLTYEISAARGIRFV
jgi:hypothetical protein